MDLEIWLAFVLASLVLLAIPGPTVMLVVSYALGRGRSSAWATVPGVALGDLSAMTASLLGAGALLAASATLFTVLKLVGAAYLIWLGIQLWRAKPSLDGLEGGKFATAGYGQMFWNSYVVTALNPKSILFFVTFVPQFIDPQRPLVMQLVIFEATFVSLAAFTLVLWALLAGEMHARFKRAATMRLINRLGGSFLIAAGVLAATLHRA
ncbi:MAG: LysE family translocator [Proteobacteria bacterium]|nr:LysE family translocator [Pseudomonadota bacterium]MDA1354929.1 LysE family translocator [Pseudomonadota bacterium]